MNEMNTTKKVKGLENHDSFIFLVVFRLKILQKNEHNVSTTRKILLIRVNIDTI